MNALVNNQYDESCASLNLSLVSQLLNLNEEQILKKTHFFSGRYENIYVDVKKFPELEYIIYKAKEHAAGILDLPINRLKIGCWLNIMYQNHTTSLHRHDDDDELLSGVYYLKVPEHSGHFIFHFADEQQTIEPVEGNFLFFSPTLNHEVTVHQSTEPRVSIGFNVGPLNAEEAS